MKRIVLICIVIGLFCVGCINNKPDDPVARVGEYYLNKSDIVGIVPQETSFQDSIEIIKNFVNNWIRQKLILNQAEKNLISEQKKFDKQLKDYRSSLIIYEYERKLIRQNLDTIVSDQEIEKYYNGNKSQFVLKDNIVKGLYVKMDINSPDIRKVKNMMKSDDIEERYKLEDYCLQNLSNYFIDDQGWLLFNDLLKEIPINPYNQEQYLRYNRFIEISDSLFHYMLNIKDFNIKEGISPLSFERENIRDIIINKRKQKLINEMEDEVYKTALKKKHFHIY